MEVGVGLHLNIIILFYLGSSGVKTTLWKEEKSPFVLNFLSGDDVIVVFINV